MDGGEATPLHDGGDSVEARRRRNHHKHRSSGIVRAGKMVVGTTMGVVLVLMLTGYSTMRRRMDRSRTVPAGSQSLLTQLSEDSAAASSGQKCCDTPINPICMLYYNLCCPNKHGFDGLCWN